MMFPQSRRDPSLDLVSREATEVWSFFTLILGPLPNNDYITHSPEPPYSSLSCVIHRINTSHW